MRESKIIYLLALAGVAGAIAMLASMLAMRKNEANAIVPEESPPRLEILGKAPDFELVSHDGGVVTAKSLRGYVWVVDFFFASCQGVCPVMKKGLSEIQEVFKSDDDLKLISITVDPERDTAQALQGFANEHGAIPGKWRFLTGNKEEITRASRQGFKLGASEVPGEILHSDRFVLVDREGNIRGYYRGVERTGIEDIIRDAKTLLSEPGRH